MIHTPDRRLKGYLLSFLSRLTSDFRVTRLVIIPVLDRETRAVWSLDTPEIPMRVVALSLIALRRPGSGRFIAEIPLTKIP